MIFEHCTFEIQLSKVQCNNVHAFNDIIIIIEQKDKVYSELPTYLFERKSKKED